MNEREENMNQIRIRDLRKKKGVTQSHLARRIGISRSSVNAWETGLTMPSVSHLIDLADYFNVSTDFLLGRDMQSVVSIEDLKESDARIIYELIDRLQDE